WSSEDVFLDTVLDLKKHEASYHILSTLNDVDREEDLTEELKQLLEKQDS
ncbi:MAG: glycosyltransferase, partial [Flavobacteriales bacterium]|nr:glycosyltransferase [Flavobacteriales bacterium]